MARASLRGRYHSRFTALFPLAVNVHSTLQFFMGSVTKLLTESDIFYMYRHSIIRICGTNHRYFHCQYMPWLHFSTLFSSWGLIYVLQVTCYSCFLVASFLFSGSSPRHTRELKISSLIRAVSHNLCIPSWPDVFQFGTFLTIFLRDSRCMLSAPGPSSYPCYSFHALYPFGLSITSCLQYVSWLFLYRHLKLS